MLPVNSNNSFQCLSISSELRSVRAVEQQLLAELHRHKCTDECLFAIRLALEEGLANAIKHGNRLDPKKTVDVRFSVDHEKVQIIITDQGQGFDPAGVPDPTTDEHLEDPSGRGITLMQAYMDEVVYNSRGNEVRMLKRISSSQSRQAG